MVKMRIRIVGSDREYIEKVLKETEGIKKSNYFRSMFQKAIDYGSGYVKCETRKDDPFHICLDMSEEMRSELDKLSKESKTPIAKILRLMIMGN